jgi:putative ABC transport system ATP-binding protein
MSADSPALVARLHEERSSDRAADDAMDVVLDVRDLVKTFRAPDGESTCIVDVPRFRILRGEHIALAGTSGSGKTTFLHLIAGILAPDRGTIVLDGALVSDLGEAARDRLRACTIGYVFQTFNLLQSCTALENVLLGMWFGRGPDRAHAVHLLERVGLRDRADHKPRQLSVGQQQRVAVARALANHPKLVLADEPTGNLDAHHARGALDLIGQICRENAAALLLVSHDRTALRRFGRVIDLASINRATGEPPRASNGGSEQPVDSHGAMHGADNQDS